MDKLVTTYIFQAQSLAIVLLMYIGVYWARSKKWTRHGKIMGSIVIWDILLILQIELNRGAVLKATEAMSDWSAKAILNVHVSMAIVTVLLYFFLVFAGRRILKGEASERLRQAHRMAGRSAVTLRTLTFLTSFFVA